MGRREERGGEEKRREEKRREGKTREEKGIEEGSGGIRVVPLAHTP